MSEQPAEQPGNSQPMDHSPAEAGQELRTRTSGRWMRKMVIFFVVCFGLGSWGLYDAVKAYPNRGRLHSEFMLSDYLKAADETGLIVVPRQVNVPDPAQEIVRLESQAELNAYEQLRYRWLESLRPLYGKSLERLTEENQAMEQRPADERTDTRTVFQQPSQVYSELTTKLQGRQLPKPLSQTDIAVQWLICIVGYLGALFILFRIVQTRSTVYRYQPDEHKLILPGRGKSITPDQIEVVDKSKWHKFFVALELKSGETHKFDLLRFEPLEDWILEMEDSDPRLRAMREEAEAEEEAANEAAADETSESDPDPLSAEGGAPESEAGSRSDDPKP